MRNPSLEQTLGDFVAEAAQRLDEDARAGAALEFDLVEEPGGSSPLYCYRPLTADFIAARSDELRLLPSFPAAVRALAELDGLTGYLRARGELHVPAAPRERAEAALKALLDAVFDGASDFALADGRFEAAHRELERALLCGARPSQRDRAAARARSSPTSWRWATGCR